MKKIDLLDIIDDEDRIDCDKAKLLEDIRGSKSESFDDHQQWMIDSFDDL